MVRLAVNPSLREASCCKVDVVNGARRFAASFAAFDLGHRVRGRFHIDQDRLDRLFIGKLRVLIVDLGQFGDKGWI